MRLYLCVISLLWMCGASYAQSTLHFDHVKKVAVTKKPIVLDTLTPAPGSVRVWAICKKDWLQDKDFSVNYTTHTVTFASHICDTVLIHYRTLPYNLTKSYALKNYTHYNKIDSMMRMPYYYYPTASNANANLFDLGGVSSAGSYSRGISFGSNQDLVVNSAFNMQLNGRLSDIDITAAISDNNVPIQPDGNTQSLQEFDKVFIQFKKNNTRLILGDFESEKPAKDYYLGFTRKLEGLGFSSAYTVDKVKFLTQSGVAVARGSFVHQTITPIEGNQGPYKLYGNNGEVFIVVLAGSENVYIDGVLLKRGSDKDYVIDYNQGQVTFTPNRIVTTDSRIVVEFQYSNQNYLRVTEYLYQQMQWGKWRASVDYYSEGDNKNQPLNQTLSTQDVQTLAAVGDSVQRAYHVAADSQAFNSNLVMYKRISYAGIGYIYVYSTNADSAHYVVSFTDVGSNKGHYILIPSSANGNVYQFEPDINGIHQGDYEPIIPLVAPNHKQLLSTNLSYDGGKQGKYSLDAAWSDYNQNTFSTLDKADDQGLATRFTYSNKLGKDSSHLWNINAHYEFTQSTFTTPEVYRPIEFNRDWNLTNVPLANEQYITTSILFSQTQKLSVGLSIAFLNRETYYTGLNTTFNLRYGTKRESITTNVSVLQTNASTFKGVFIRPTVNYNKVIGKKGFWRTGATYAQEYNALHTIGPKDTLTATSYHNIDGKVFLTNADTTHYVIGADFDHRYDFAPSKDVFVLLNTSNTASLRVSKRFSKHFILNTRATYRIIDIHAPELTTLTPTKTSLLHADGSWNQWKGALNLTFLYEISTGQEQKISYTYVQVPAGQGVYQWIDYNGDGIKQANEFVVAQYPDQAQYVRVQNLTNVYETDYTARAAIGLYLTPASIWLAEKNNVKKWLSKFQLQSVLQSNRKIEQGTDENYFVPIVLPNNKDTSVISASTNLNNGLYFNRFSPHWGIDLVNTISYNVQLLNGGTQSTGQNERYLKLRITPKSAFVTNSYVRLINKNSASDLYANLDYQITTWQGEEQVTWQTSSSWRAGLSYTYSYSVNTDTESMSKAISHKITAETKYNTKSHSSLQATLTYEPIKYTGSDNTATSYAMLDALQPGQNWIWSLTWDKKLSQYLNLSIGYDGRSSPGSKIVNTGRAQIRAVF